MAHRMALFAELQHLIPGHVFEKLERKHKSGRASRKFGFLGTIRRYCLFYAGGLQRNARRNPEFELSFSQALSLGTWESDALYIL